MASAESTAAEVEGNWVRMFALSSHNPVSCTRASTMCRASVSFCKVGDSCFKMNKKWFVLMCITCKSIRIGNNPPIKVHKFKMGLSISGKTALASSHADTLEQFAFCYYHYGFTTSTDNYCALCKAESNSVPRWFKRRNTFRRA